MRTTGKLLFWCAHDRVVVRQKVGDSSVVKIIEVDD
jgi:hypothetical protein